MVKVKFPLHLTCLQDVDEKVEQIVFWVEEFRVNQSFQVEILWEKMTVVEYAAHKGLWFIP
jgi:hypothetical protein